MKAARLFSQKCIMAAGIDMVMKCLILIEVGIGIAGVVCFLACVMGRQQSGMLVCRHSPQNRKLVAA
ncbi:MAG: hypothetical protein JWM42_3384 [Burkholderia sp.]|nr:hypothetical protein [Burkholderia sp.]